MADFPTYAKLLDEPGLPIKRLPAVSRTDFEDGMVKQLKTKSRVLVQREVKYKLTSLSDYNSFITWFQTTIKYGADWFNWTDPVDSTVKSARIVSALNIEEPFHGLLTHWRISLTIETWSG